MNATVSKWDSARDCLLACHAESGDTRTFNKASCRKFVERAELAFPEELDWAEDVILNHTSYSRRRYGTGFYCYAEFSVVHLSGRALSVDPWPASTYPRASLLTMLILAKISDPGLAIASSVTF